jgi:hypothetical protein
MVALTVASLLAAFRSAKALFAPRGGGAGGLPHSRRARGIVAVVKLLSTFGHILSYAHPAWAPPL